MSFDCRILLRVPSGRHCINRTMINQQLPDLTINIAVFASLNHCSTSCKRTIVRIDISISFNCDQCGCYSHPKTATSSRRLSLPNSTRQPPHLRTDHSQHNNKTPPFLCDPLSSHQVDGLHYPYNPPILPCGLYILVRPIGMRT
jgi:hypothetical protein